MRGKAALKFTPPTHYVSAFYHLSKAYNFFLCLSLPFCTCEPQIFDGFHDPLVLEVNFVLVLLMTVRLKMVRHPPLSSHQFHSNRSSSCCPPILTTYYITIIHTRAQCEQAIYPCFLPPLISFSPQCLSPVCSVSRCICSISLVFSFHIKF